MYPSHKAVFKLKGKEVYRDSSACLSVQEGILLRVIAAGDAPLQSSASAVFVALGCLPKERGEFVRLETGHLKDKDIYVPTFEM